MDQSDKKIVQKQSAGENSKQFQIENVVINQGITEERARSVFTEMIPQALEKYTQEACETANQRIMQLENSIIPRMHEVDEELSSFSDSAFQMILRKAQQSAASTERAEDYALLAELIVCQIQKGNNRKNRTGISKAIEIVGNIDGDALCALTIVHAVNAFFPSSGDIRTGLQVLDGLFEKLYYLEPPTDSDWLDHLDILGAIRISKLVRLKKLADYYSDYLNGYVCVGIKVGSDEYKKALEVLSSVNLNSSTLIPNELMDGYVKLPVRNKEAIQKMSVIKNMQTRDISSVEIEALEKIWAFYEQDSSLIQIVKMSFVICGIHMLH